MTLRLQLVSLVWHVPQARNNHTNEHAQPDYTRAFDMWCLPSVLTQQAWAKQTFNINVRWPWPSPLQARRRRWRSRAPRASSHLAQALRQHHQHVHCLCGRLRRPA